LRRQQRKRRRSPPSGPPTPHALPRPRAARSAPPRGRRRRPTRSTTPWPYRRDAHPPARDATRRPGPDAPSRHEIRPATHGARAELITLPSGASRLLGRPPPRPAGFGTRSGRAHRLDLDLDLHLVADQHAARHERLVPVQAVLLAVDARPRGERHALAAPRILDASAILHVEHHGLGVAAHGQLTVHSVVLPLALHLRALEADRRVRLHVEEVGGAEVLVSSLVAGVHAVRVDLDPHLASRGLRLVELEAPSPRPEPPPDLGHHQVPHPELDARVTRIELPLARRHALSSTVGGPPRLLAPGS